MHLYLVQHATAVPKDENPERPISDSGRQDVGRMASFLARSGVRPGRVIHSGKLRAAQTALMLSEVLGFGRMVEEAEDGLAPNDPTDRLAAVVNGWEEDTMVVGHLPHLGRLTARLVTGQEENPVVHFQPGTVVCLERGENGEGWTIMWVVRPHLLGG